MLDEQAVLEEQAGNGLVPSDAEASRKTAFINRQKDLLEACCRGEVLEYLCPEETMLVDLVRNNSCKNPGLRSYLHNMMAAMEFDAERRGRLITQAELAEYSRQLAMTVTDSMYCFIDHGDSSPRHQDRYLPATAAHLTHMLRDTLVDIDTGYLNIPREYLQAFGVSPWDVESQAYRDWVRERVSLAREYFKAGRAYLAKVKNLRRRLAGYAYAARFEWMLQVIERDQYRLRPAYRERKGLQAVLWMSWTILAAMFASIWNKRNPQAPAVRPTRIEEL